MKPFVSGRILGAIAGVAMLPFVAAPAAAQMPSGSYLQSCRDGQVRGDRLTALCRTQDGRWNRTSIGNIGQCAGGIANSNGRLVCGRQGGGFNMGSDDGRDRRGRDDDRRAGRDRRDDDRRGDRDWRDRDRRADRDWRDQDWRRDRDGRADQRWRRDGDGYGSGYGPYGPGPGRDPWGRW
ncbi:MAG: hypothetical protein AB7H90_14840 [Alphaproteobacteria bacterium]